MSWQDIIQRVLPPVGGVLPHVTSPYGEVEGRPPGSSTPHRAVDFNYVGGQTGINLQHPTLRSPVAGIVTRAGQDKYGTIAIRDADGYSHEILHTNGRYVSVGDPVAAGQLIGTMGNTGAEQQHVHYQLKDIAGKMLNPIAFWDRQGPADPIPSPPDHLQEYQKYLQSLGINTDNGFGSAPKASSARAMPFVQQHVLFSDRSDSSGDRYGKWGSSPARISPLLPSDRPESFDNRFGNWGSAPAGDASNGNSAFLRALERYRRSAAPDGPASVAAAPSSTPPNASGPGFGSQLAGGLNTVGTGAVRMLSGIAKYVGDSLITPADGSAPALPVRRLVGRIVDDPRTSAFDTGAPAAPSPSNGFLSPDRADSFGDRFGNWAPSAASVPPDNRSQSSPPRQTGDGGILKYYNNSPAQAPAAGPGDIFSPPMPGPRQSRGSAPPYTSEYLQFLNQLNGNNSPAPVFDPANPPPLFAPANYPTAFGNNSIERWIASLTGADPEDPTPFAMPAMFNPYLGR
jgi:hypothetical protein